MKKKMLVVGLAALSLTLCGCQKTIPKLENGEEAVVSFKDGSLISVNELYTKLKNSYATSIIIDMVDEKILNEKYADKLSDAEADAKSNLESVKTYYTDDAGNYDEDSLVQALNQYYGYTSVKEYEDALKLNYLRNLAVEDYAKTKVEESEIEKYYKEQIVGDREVSHIQIIPAVKDNMTDEEKKEQEDKALEKAKEVIAKLKKGEKFEDLAKEYSDDEATKDNGGSLGFINKGSYGSTEFDNEVYRLTKGSYSTTPVKTTEAYEIVYVTDEKEKEPLENVRDEILDKLKDNLLTDDQTLQVNGLKELRKEYGVDIVDEEVNASYQKHMNRLLDQALKANVGE